jgi:hypothetical protein
MRALACGRWMLALSALPGATIGSGLSHHSAEGLADKATRRNMTGHAVSLGRNVTTGCRRLFVDVGGNIGQSVNQWYAASNHGRGSKEFAAVANWSHRHTFCTDVFEANRNFNGVLKRVQRLHRERGRDVQLYLGTPFSIGGGVVPFYEMPYTVNSGGTLSFEATPAARGGPPPRKKIVELQAMDAVRYVREFEGEHLVIKIDVETYEFKLLRGLIASGALCAPGRKLDLLVEWHLPRTCSTCAGDVLDAVAEGLPADANTTKQALLWMLQSPVCESVTPRVWW